MGILDTIMHTKQHDSLKAFKPSELVSDIISALKDRDKQILTQRYGLDGSELRTLAAIGTEHKLTRERVRQIEKDLLKQLKKVGLERDEFLATKELLIATVHEHGKVIAQDRLLKAIGVTEEQDRNAIIFLLHLVEELEKRADLPGHKKPLLLLDNASIHRSRLLTALVSRGTVELLYTPSYSPMLNPVEFTNNRLKKWLGTRAKMRR